MYAHALDRFARVIDDVNTRVGKAVSWLYPLLMIVIVFNVVLRYVFSRGSIELEEIQWHLYAAGFLLGFAYTYVDDAHVRVDFIYASMSERKKAFVDLFGCLFLLLPFAGFLVYYSVPYFLESWAFNERSEMPSGLPARYVIKGILVIGFALLFLQGVSVVIRKVLFLAGYPTREVRR
ncbi:MAG: TRAP transporter small permease subunit [Alphaproteobacteria bacterium]